VPLVRFLFRRCVALPLAGDHMHQHRAGLLPHLLQRRHEDGDAVAVDGPHVLQAQLLEQLARHEERLDRVGQAARRLEHLVADARDALEDGLDVADEQGIGLAVDDALEIARPGPHVGRDGHLVVVQDDDQVAAQVARLVDRLHGHAAGERAVADHGDDVVVPAGHVPPRGQPQRGADGGGGVPGVERVVLALLAFAEAADPLVLAQRREAVAAAGEDLVGVALVGDVPDDLVAGRVEHVVQRQGQLHHAEVRGEVAAVLGHHLDEQIADLLGQDVHLLEGELLQVGREVDFFDHALIHPPRRAAILS